jgi:hypothetical protein
MCRLYEIAGAQSDPDPNLADLEIGMSGIDLLHGLVPHVPVERRAVF